VFCASFVRSFVCFFKEKETLRSVFFFLVNSSLFSFSANVHLRQGVQEERCVYLSKIDGCWFTSRYFGFAASKNTNAWLQEEHYSFVLEKYGLMYRVRERVRATSFSKEVPTIQLQRRRGR
jgi:hypothetical protein